MKFLKMIKEFAFGAALLMHVSSVLAASCIGVPDQTVAPALYSQCTAPAQKYVITIYEIGVCTGGANRYSPTETSASTNLSECKLIYSNPSGQSVSLTNAGDLINLDGASWPPVGSYSTAYFVLKNAADLQASLGFTTVIDDGRVGSSSGNGQGNYCWTSPSPDSLPLYASAASLDTQRAYPYTRCGRSDQVSPQPYRIIFDKIGESANQLTVLNKQIFLVNANSLSAAKLASQRVGNSYTDAQGFLAFIETPLNITENSVPIDMQFNVTDGVNVKTMSETGGIKTIKPIRLEAFDFRFSGGN